MDENRLWKGYKRFTTEVKRHYGLPEKSHVRYREDRQGRHVAYVVKRSSPSRGFSFGNFAVGAAEIRWLMRRLESRTIQTALVVLVEDYGGEVTACATPREVRDLIGAAEPSINSEGGAQYHWLDETFRPLGEARDPGEAITAPPF